MPVMSPVPPMPMPPVTMPPATMPPMQVPPMPGPAAGSTRSLAPSGLPTLVADEISQVGSKPLVTDPKLGWSTSVKLTAPNDGSHTRLQSGQVNVRLQSNTRWVVLSFALVLVVAALVVLILET